MLSLTGLKAIWKILDDESLNAQSGSIATRSEPMMSNIEVAPLNLFFNRLFDQCEAIAVFNSAPDRQQFLIGHIFSEVGITHGSLPSELGKPEMQR